MCRPRRRCPCRAHQRRRQYGDRRQRQLSRRRGAPLPPRGSSWRAPARRRRCTPSGRRRSRRAWTSTTRSLGGRSTRCRSRWTGSCAVRARRRSVEERAPRLAAAVGALEASASKFSLKTAQTSQGARRRGARRRGRRGGAAAVLARGVRGSRAGVPGDRGAYQQDGSRATCGGRCGASQTGVANGGSRDFGVGIRRRARACERRISTLKVKHLERS